MALSLFMIAEEPHRAKSAPGGIGEDRPPIPTLPREVIPPATWGRVIVLFGVFFSVLAGLNLAADAYLSRYTPNRGNWLVQEKWKLVDEASPSIEWIILGDSSCNQGLDPEIWDSEFATRSLNLCTIGSTILLDDVWMLQRLLGRGVKPRGVLIIHVDDVWQRDPNPKVLGQIPQRSVWSSGKPRVALNLRETGLELLSRFVPIVSQNSALRSSLIHPRTWFQRKFSLSPKGFMAVSDANPQRVERDAHKRLRMARKRLFRISEPNQAALEEIRRISEAHGIEVFLVPSPIFEELLTNKDFVARIESMHVELSAWARSGSQLNYLPELVPFPKTAMENADHVTEEAARCFTRRIAALVRAMMNARPDID